MSEICCEKETLGMATIPMQKWCGPSDYKTALQVGTIFPSLDLEFYKAVSNFTPACPSPASSDRESAMNEINAVSFALNDLTLYLDTHPKSQEGLSLFKELLTKRMDLLADYAAKYNPLTQLSIATGTPDINVYSWAEGPLPWEGGHI